MTSALDDLLHRVTESGLLDDAAPGDGLVHGRTELEAAGVIVAVDLDPEGDDGDADPGEIIDGLRRILSVSERRWHAIVDEAATDIEDAVGEAEVTEQRDLRDDMEATAIVVFADAVHVSFAAPKQFPDSRILVQLDDELEVTGVEVADV